MTASYSVNGKPIDFDRLKDLQITKKDYIDYIEELRKKANKHINMKKG